jgi:SAM-dependent methyltransferase
MTAMDPEFAARYADLANWHWWFRGRERILANVLRRELPPLPNRRMLAVGGGPPEQLSWLKEFSGPRGCILGLDVDPIHARQPPQGVHHILGDLLAPPFPGGSVDVVLALDVIEHLDDDAAGLREATRLLRPGGMLLATVPALPSLWGTHDVINRHRRRYTKRTLCEAFASAGLPSPRVTYFNAIFFPCAAAVRWTRRALGAEVRLDSDLGVRGPGFFNDFMAAIFGLEAPVVARVALPIGVSLLARVCVPGEQP